MLPKVSWISPRFLSNITATHSLLKSLVTQENPESKTKQNYFLKNERELSKKKDSFVLSDKE